MGFLNLFWEGLMIAMPTFAVLIVIIDGWSWWALVHLVSVAGWWYLRLRHGVRMWR